MLNQIQKNLYFIHTTRSIFQKSVHSFFETILNVGSEIYHRSQLQTPSDGVVHGWKTKTSLQNTFHILASGAVENSSDGTGLVLWWPASFHPWRKNFLFVCSRSLVSLLSCSNPWKNSFVTDSGVYF